MCTSLPAAAHAFSSSGVKQVERRNPSAARGNRLSAADGALSRLTKAIITISIWRMRFRHLTVDPSGSRHPREPYHNGKVVTERRSQLDIAPSCKDCEPLIITEVRLGIFIAVIKHHRSLAVRLRPNVFPAAISR